MLTVGLLALVADAFAPAIRALDAEKETAVVDLPDKTRLTGAILQGKYLFEHDEMMARGEPCMYVYRQRLEGCTAGCWRWRRKATPRGSRLIA